jgi:hypothetical protein
VRLRPRLSRPRLLPTTKRCAPVRRFRRTAVRLVIGIPAMEKPISSHASRAAPWSNRGIRRPSFVLSCRVLAVSTSSRPTGPAMPAFDWRLDGAQVGPFSLTSGTIGEMRPRRYRSARSQVSVRHWRCLRDNFAIAKRSSMTAPGPRTAAGDAPVPELLLAARCIVYPPLATKSLAVSWVFAPELQSKECWLPSISLRHFRRL